MARVSAVQCDGPRCKAIAMPSDGERAPSGWIPATMRVHDETPLRKVVFHHPECLHEWVDVTYIGHFPVDSGLPYTIHHDEGPKDADDAYDGEIVLAEAQTVDDA